MTPTPTFRIWIGGLDRDVSVEYVRWMFEEFGSIDEGIYLRIDLRHEDGGEAVVTFRHECDADFATDVNGTQLLRGELIVTRYEDRPTWSNFSYFIVR